jgi:hypothetical protein
VIAVGFSRWLRRQRDRDDPVGDLAADFCSDRTARGIRTPGELLRHMARSGACHEARLALRDAAREYRHLAHGEAPATLKVLDGGLAG